MNVIPNKNAIPANNSAYIADINKMNIIIEIIAIINMKIAIMLIGMINMTINKTNTNATKGFFVGGGFRAFFQKFLVALIRLNGSIKLQGNLSNLCILLNLHFFL